MTRIYLIRHAEAEGNLYRRGQGQYDALITERGLRQIEALRERFRDVPVDAVYSSDLYRTQKTISAIYETHGLTLVTDPGLREIDLGAWENRPWGQIAKEEGDSLFLFNTNDPSWQVAGSETFGAVRDRLVETLTRIARRHDGQTVAVASHGMAIKNLLTALMGKSVAEGKDTPSCDNTGVSLVEYENGVWNVVYMNDNSHLTEALSTLAGQKWWKSGDGFWEDANFWYRPLDPERERDFYLDCRREAWETVHGSLDRFDGAGFLADAVREFRANPDSLWQAMLREEPAGLVQLDVTRSKAEGVGYLPFVYLRPEFRGRGLGVQLIGQGVSVFRPLGCAAMRLRCAPDNDVAQRFYTKYGFRKIGEAAGSRVPLDVLEKNIGFDKT